MNRLIRDSQSHIEHVIASLVEQLDQTHTPAGARPLRQAIALLHGVLDTLTPLEHRLVWHPGRGHGFPNGLRVGQGPVPVEDASPHHPHEPTTYSGEGGARARGVR